MPAVFFTAEKGENDDFLCLKFSPAGTRKLGLIILFPSKKASATPHSQNPPDGIR
jgi:hypothetical protein